MTRSVLAAAALVLCWDLVARHLVMAEYILPRPLTVAESLARNHWQLTLSAWSTLLTALSGFLLATVFGLMLGLLAFWYSSVERAIMPVLVSVKSTPVVALAPVLSLVLGVGFVSKITLTFLVAFFPLVLSTIAGLRRVPESLTDFSASVSASAEAHLRFVLLPCAYSHILLGLRITLPLAFVGAIVAEMAGGDDSGLGYTLISANYRGDTALLYASVICVMILSSAAYYTFNHLVGLLFPFVYKSGNS